MPKPTFTLESSQLLFNWLYDEIKNILRVGLEDGQWQSLLDKLDDLIQKNNDILLEVQDDATSADINRNIAKLEEVRTEISESNDYLNDLNNKVATQATLYMCQLLLEEIRNNQATYPEPTQVEALGETDSNVTPNGIVIPFDFAPVGGIRRVFVKQTFGNPQNYNVEIFRRDPDNDPSFDFDFDKVYYNDHFNKKRHDDYIKVQDVPYQMPRGGTQLFLRITPTSGNSNKFKYGIFGYREVI